MRYEAFGQSPVDHGVMEPTGEKMTFKTMSVFIMMIEMMITVVMSFANKVWNGLKWMDYDGVDGLGII